MQLVARPASRMIARGITNGAGPALLPRPSRLPPAAIEVCLRCSLRLSLRAPAVRRYSTNPPPPPSSSQRSSSPADPPSAPPHDASSAARSSGPASSASSSATAGSRRPRSLLVRRLSAVVESLQSRVLLASQTWNDITGYSDIEAIKQENIRLEHQLADAQVRVRSSRAAYKTANARRASSQREVTALLARKDAWGPSDLERFTSLYRDDYALEAEVAGASEELAEAESEEQKLAARVSQGILRRGHEEQVWSDKLRRVSYWATWGLMGVNVLVFLLLQFVAEPWKRRRMVHSIEGVVDKLVEGRSRDDERRQAEVKDRLAELKGELSEIRDRVGRRAEAGPAPALAEAVSWRRAVKDPKAVREAVRDLYSERRIDVRMRDVSLAALEGAAAGAAIAGGMAFWFLRRT